MLEGLASLISTWPFLFGAASKERWGPKAMPPIGCLGSWKRTSFHGPFPSLESHQNCVGCEHDMSMAMHSALIGLSHMDHQGTLPPCRQCHSRDWVEHGRLRPAAAMRQCSWQEQPFGFWSLNNAFPFFSIFLIDLIVCDNAAQKFWIHDLDSPALGLGNDSGRSNSFFQGFRGT